MEPWYKFILYGNYDGFSRSTLGDDNLYLVLENGEKVEVPRCFVKNASDFIEKDKLKLKDVIARIKKLDLGTQKVWLNEILNELGSDYGTLKYKVGYEQGKFDGAMEREKVTVPQIVADYIKYAKENGWDLLKAIKNVPYEGNAEFRKWFYKGGNVEVFARAWLDGFAVVKEKKYLVKMKGKIEENVLTHGNNILRYFFTRESTSKAVRIYHTRKQLEIGGFGDVFNNPMFEVVEVEE